MNLQTVMNSEIIPANQSVPMPCCREEFRKGIFGLERYMIEELQGADFEAELKHFFADGTYSREITMLKGSFIIGAIHRYCHINVISKGIVNVWTEHDIVRYEAPITFVSKPHTKRIVSIVEDTVWTTVHATNKTDVESAEKELFTNSYESLEGGEV